MYNNNFRNLSLSLSDWLEINNCTGNITDMVKRLFLQKEYCKLVELGVILPLTALECAIVKCVGEGEEVAEHKKKLWKRIQKLPNSKLRVKLNVDALDKAFNGKLDSYIIKDNCIVNKDDVVVYRANERCLINSSNDDTVCLFGYETDSTFSLTFEEMKTSIYGDSLDMIKLYLKDREKAS